MGISIIIYDIYGNCDCTNNCIYNIENNYNVSDIEIIVITDSKYNINSSNVKIINNKWTEGVSKSWNLGVKASKKDNDIVILDSNVIISHNLISNLKKCAYSDFKVAAVAPVANISNYYQSIDDSYKSKIKEIEKKNYENSKGVCEERQKIEGYCFFIKRKILNQIRGFDDNYKTLEYAESDFSVKLLDYGYKLMLCKDTYVYRQRIDKIDNDIYNKLLDIEKKMFNNKWEFYAINKMNIDIGYLKFIKGNKPNIIEVGCGTGATAKYIMNRISCNYYGIDTSDLSLSYYKGTKMHVVSYPEYLKQINVAFEYILISDVSEILDSTELQKILCSKISYVTRIIIKSSQISSDNIFMVKNIFKELSVIKSYEYNDLYGKQKYIVLYSDILDKLKEITYQFTNGKADISCLINYFMKNNFSCEDIISVVELFFQSSMDILFQISKICIRDDLFDCKKILQFLIKNDSNNSKILMALSRYYLNNKEYYLARQYIEKLRNDSEESKSIKKEVNMIISVIEDVKKLLWRVEFNIDTDDSLAKLFKVLDEKDLYEKLLLKSITKYSVDKIYMLNYVAIKLFEYQKYQYIIPLLLQAYQINNQDSDTTYNLAYILNQFGEKDIALNYLYKLNNKDANIKTLIEEIRGKAYE